MPIRNTNEDFETWRIRHKPDRKPKKIKDPMLGYELRTHAEVAMLLGVSRQRVVQIEKSALEKLRRGLREFYENL